MTGAPKSSELSVIRKKSRGNALAEALALRRYKRLAIFYENYS